MKRLAKGFTLIELLVAIALFTVTITFVLTSFLSFLQYQILIQDERNALRNIEEALELTSRELRLGRNYTSYVYTDNEKTSARDLQSWSCIVFKDQIQRIVKFRFNDGLMDNDEDGSIERAVRLIEGAEPNCSNDNNDEWVTVIGGANSNISIDAARFIFKNPSSKVQPSVEIRIEASYKLQSRNGTIETIRSTFKTRVSQRVLEANQTIANEFSIGSNLARAGSLLSVYYVKAEDVEDEDGDIGVAVCVDREGNKYGIGICKNIQENSGIRQIEKTPEHLYLLSENGLIFYISISDLNLVIDRFNEPTGKLDVDGKAVYGEKNIDTLEISNSFKRLRANEKLSKVHEPINIEKIHVDGKNNLYAVSSSDELFISPSGSSNRYAIKILNGRPNNRLYAIGTGTIGKNTESVVLVYNTGSGRRMDQITKLDGDDGFIKQVTEHFIPTAEEEGSNTESFQISELSSTRDALEVGPPLAPRREAFKREILFNSKDILVAKKFIYVLTTENAIYSISTSNNKKIKVRKRSSDTNSPKELACAGENNYFFSDESGITELLEEPSLEKPSSNITPSQFIINPKCNSTDLYALYKQNLHKFLFKDGVFSNPQKTSKGVSSIREGEISSLEFRTFCGRKGKGLNFIKGPSSYTSPPLVLLANLENEKGESKKEIILFYETLSKFHNLNEININDFGNSVCDSNFDDDKIEIKRWEDTNFNKTGGYLLKLTGLKLLEEGLRP